MMFYFRFLDTAFVFSTSDDNAILVAIIAAVASVAVAVIQKQK